MAAPRVAVAYSGGRDSTALLHATVAAAAGHGVEVIALQDRKSTRLNSSHSS